MENQESGPPAGATQEVPPEADLDEMPAPLLPRLMAALRGSGPLRPGRWLSNRWVRLVAAVVVLLVIVYVGHDGIARVRGDEVGVLVNNFTGNLALKEAVGYYVFVPYVSQLYVLPRTIQHLNLGWRQGPGGAGRDLKLKTADGSNVSVDVAIDFKLIPQKAAEVLRHSGPSRRVADTWIADTWVEPFARHVCFSSLGQLTSEEMYDAVKRNEKAQAALQELNTQLGPYGIEIVTLTPGEFRFYKEYEDVIRQKKLADQKVEEQQAQARAALQDQRKQLVEAEKKKETKIAAVEGECANDLIIAEAEADKTKREATGKYNAALLAADGGFYLATQQAKGQRMLLLAKAEGMEQMRKAMTGEGGLNLVGMEYANRLSQIRLSATPITKEPSVHQFAVQEGAAAATQAAPPPATPKSAGAAGPDAVPVRMPPRSALPFPRPSIQPPEGRAVTTVQPAQPGVAEEAHP